MPAPPHSHIASEQSESQDQKATNENARDQKSTQNQNQNGSQKSQKSRHRASVACASCRDRRIRCVVPPGDKECTQCKRSGVECIIKNDDERRRPISRAYMCSLTDRVAMLETMLKERGAEPPPANHPPKTRHGLPRDEDTSPSRKTAGSKPTVPEDQSSPGSQPSPQDGFADMDGDNIDNHSHHGDAESTGSPSMLPPPKKDGMVSRLLSTRGHLSFDQLSGRLRYFGPTTNCHVHSDAENPFDTGQESFEQARRAEKIIRSLPLETYEYLMDLFWTFYNPVIHVLHQEAFNEDRESGRTQFYSGFLHVCVLAMGFRFADKSRADIQKIALPQMECTLHREAKYMLDHELERPGGVPSVVALLILGDLECGIGRDNIGWLYGGLAVRLAFDIGLHLDSRASGLSEREIDIRQMTLWACVMYDKYWSLYLGRPTSIKSSDVEIYTLSRQFERLGTCKPAGPEKSMETTIYEALIDLMELAGKITENMDPRSQNDSVIDRNQYLRMAALDREFSNWYSRLPEQLRWTPANISAAPYSFFLLHQQYHASLILLHRPFAMYEDHQQQGYEGSGPDDHFSALSRTVCTKHAIRVARIFWQHRQRFDNKQIFVTGLQHAGTAATALVAALAFIKDPNDRNNNMQYLECLSAALQDMAYTYQPAQRMSTVLRAVMLELRGDDAQENTSNLYKSRPTLIPARRGSTAEANDVPIYKKRQTSRPRAGTGSSRKGRTMSMASAASNMDLNIKPPPARFDADGSERGDGYIMVTPRSEISSWPVDTPVLDPALSAATPSTLSSSAPRNAWMGAELDNTDSITQLAHAHFPEMHALSGDDQMSLDFMSLGEIGVEWGREWQPAQGVNVGSDLDGFPPQGGFGVGNFGTGNEKFGLMSS